MIYGNWEKTKLAYYSLMVLKITLKGMIYYRLYLSAKFVIAYCYLCLLRKCSVPDTVCIT